MHFAYIYPLYNHQIIHSSLSLSDKWMNFLTTSCNFPYFCYSIIEVIYDTL